MIPETLQAHDGVRLHTYQWPVENPKAIVFLSHGYGEHMGRYPHVAEAINAAGYTVYAIDHRYHGQSGGDPRWVVRDLDQLVDDYELLFEAAPDNLRRFLLGHSMGGNIATRFALRHQDKLHGLVTSGAGVLLLAIPDMATNLLGAVGKIIPSVPIAAPIEISTLTNDTAIQENTKADPLYYKGKVDLGTATAMSRAGMDALQRAHKLTLPILILHGADDEVVPPLASQRLHQLVASQDKALKIYPHMKHEIMSEIDRQAVLHTITDWLDAHL